MLALREKRADEQGRGGLDQAMVKDDNGYVLLMGTDKDAGLIVITNATAKLGLMFLYARRAAQSTHWRTCWWA